VKKKFPRKFFKVHLKSRSDMVVKYFSEKVSPAVHDKAARKGSFGFWKEASMHFIYENKERRLRKVAEERKIRNKSKSDMVIKYFAERVSPAVHDTAAKKEAFGNWKEFLLHYWLGKKAAMFQMNLQEEEAWRREAETRERESHSQTRSDLIVKYFSERVSPGIHDAAAKKEGFGIWKEIYM
jgi:hypothetical protein